MRPGGVDSLGGEIDGCDAAGLGQVDKQALAICSELERLRMRGQREVGFPREVEPQHGDCAASVAGQQLCAGSVEAQVVRILPELDFLERLKGVAVETANRAVAAAGHVDGAVGRRIRHSLRDPSGP